MNLPIHATNPGREVIVSAIYSHRLYRAAALIGAAFNLAALVAANFKSPTPLTGTLAAAGITIACLLFSAWHHHRARYLEKLHTRHFPSLQLP